MRTEFKLAVQRQNQRFFNDTVHELLQAIPSLFEVRFGIRLQKPYLPVFVHHQVKAKEFKAVVVCLW